MTTLREALEMALAALEDINKLSFSPGGIALPAEIDTAMDLLREALAEESKADPVARDGWVLRDVYFHDGEPGMHRDPNIHAARQPIYTTPPQRQPLTDGEISSLISTSPPSFAVEIVRIIERAHGIGSEE
jgi:hypothetical protein